MRTQSTNDQRGGVRAVVMVLVGVVAAVAVAVAAVLVLGGDGAGPDPERGGEDDRGPGRAADQQAVKQASVRFAQASAAGRPGSEGGTAQPAAEVDAAYRRAVDGLGDLALEVDLLDTALDGDRATASLETAWTVAGTTWSTSGTLELERDDEATGDQPGWRPRWSLAALDDRLADGDRLTAERTAADRGDILDGAGAPLLTPTSVVVVGVEPRRATDVDVLALQLTQLLTIDAAALAARIRAAAPDAFVEVVTLRRSDYEPLRDRLQPLPGTVFREETQDLPPSRTFARAVLGRVGPATAEDVAASDGRLAAGDSTGQGGLQERYDAALSGTPGLDVTVTRAPDEGTGSTTTEAESAPTPEVLETTAATPGASVRTTLDGRVQLAAEAALAGDVRTSALVALRVSTGEVLALANGPAGQATDVASTARVPPGSAFKVVSTLALLRRGLTPDDVVPCPATATVGGRSFRNADDFALGDVIFRTDFVRSCNTSFVALAERLEPDDLAEAGTAFGLGQEWDPGLDAFTGSVPTTTDDVDRAAAAIGQGRLLTSPLSLAGVAATVAAGTWRAPRLVVDPAPPAPPAAVPLGPGEAETLRDLMFGVVTEGSGTALLGVPGGPVAAKTGTAEFGTEVPPRSHAWVIGFQGDVAFAVFVEAGEAGGAVAGPLAARFLTTLAGG